MNADRTQHVLELDAPVVLRRRSKRGAAIELRAGVELGDEIVAELRELRIDRRAAHEIDRLHDEALSVERELHRISETGFLKCSHDWSTALEVPDLVEMLITRPFGEGNRSSERLDDRHELESKQTLTAGRGLASTSAPAGLSQGHSGPAGGFLSPDGAARRSKPGPALPQLYPQAVELQDGLRNA